MDKLPAQPIQGIIDGTAALRELATHGAPLSCAELAAALDLDRTRANRVLKTLAGLGFARQVAGRKYVCGPAIHSLAAQSLYASGLLQAAYPYLLELEGFGHTAALGMLWRNTVSYLFHGSSQETEGIPLARMAMHPAETSSIGVAFLAEKSDAEIRQLFAGKVLDPRCPNGLDGLLETVAAVRRDGFADLRPGTESHSMAVRIGSPAIAALAVAGEFSGDKIAFFRDYLLRAAAEILRGMELKGKA